MDASRHSIGQVVKRECGLVAVGALCLVPAIARPEPSQDQVRPRKERMEREAEEPPMLPEPVPGLYMIVPLGSRVAQGGRLLRGENPPWEAARRTRERSSSR